MIFIRLQILVKCFDQLNEGTYLAHNLFSTKSKILIGEYPKLIVKKLHLI